MSSPRPCEEGIPRRIAEDLSILSCAKGDFLFYHHDITCERAFRSELKNIKAKCASGLRPILHLDMHGDRNNGLEVGRSRTNISWSELVSLLRPINVETKNNLVLIITACHGLYVINPITIHKPTPLFGLIAPQENIEFHEVDDAVGPFYRELMESHSLDTAFTKLSKNFQYFHSEKMLIISMAKYIRRYCMGRRAVERREALLTEALENGLPNTKEIRKATRKIIKAGIKADQRLLDQYAKRFLHGKKSSVTMADIQNELRS